MYYERPSSCANYLPIAGESINFNLAVHGWAAGKWLSCSEPISQCIFNQEKYVFIRATDLVAVQILFSVVTSGLLCIYLNARYRLHATDKPVLV